jgi:hypothetical protein
MFKVIFSILSLLVGYGIYAQGQPTIELNRERLSKDPRFKKNSFVLPNSINPKDLNQNKVIPVSPDLPVDTARYSHSTAKGMVYLLPGSNMPMLKPSTGLQVMPGTSEIINPFIPQAGQIPNGIQPRVMIFEKPPGK